jgi:hypothetical protein
MATRAQKRDPKARTPGAWLGSRELFSKRKTKVCLERPDILAAVSKRFPPN